MGRAAVVLVAVLGLVACGGDDEDAATATTEVAAETTTASTEPPATTTEPPSPTTEVPTTTAAPVTIPLPSSPCDEDGARFTSNDHGAPLICAKLADGTLALAAVHSGVVLDRATRVALIECAEELRQAVVSIGLGSAAEWSGCEDASVQMKVDAGSDSFIALMDDQLGRCRGSIEYRMLTEQIEKDSDIVFVADACAEAAEALASS